MRIFLSIFLMLFCLYATNGQVDSLKLLKNKIKNLKVSPEFKNQQIKYIELINLLGRNIKHYKTDTIIFLANEALELSNSLNYEKGKIEANYNKATYELYIGNPKKAISLNLRNLKNKTLIEYPLLKANIYNELGHSYYVNGNYPESYKSFLNSLEIAEDLNNYDLIIKETTNLGTIFSLLTDYNQSLKYYTQALNKLKPKDSTITRSSILVNLGFLFLKQKELKKASNYVDQSIELLKKEKKTTFLAFAYNTKAEILNKNGDYENAISFYNKSLQICNQLNYTKGKADLLYGLGMANFGLSNLIKAKEYIEKSLQVFKIYSLKNGIEQCYRALYQISKKNNNIANSLTYLELAQKTSDSISLEKQKRDVSMLQAKLDYELEKENVQLIKDNEIYRHKIYIGLIALCLLILVIIFIFIYRANTFKKKINDLLKERTKILSQQKTELDAINKNQDKLFSIVGHDLRGPILSLKEMLTLYLEDENGKEYFAQFAPKFKKDLNHIALTLENLLQWGKVQMKGYQLNPRKVDIRLKISQILKLFEESLIKKSITLENNIVDGTFAFADPNHVKVILRNLIGNAIKFTPEKGKITISSETSLTELVIKINDTGVGMSKEVLNILFKNTAHHTTFGTNNEKGTGLGLRLSKEMVDRNDGEILVESTLGIGTTFFIKLPLKAN